MSHSFTRHPAISLPADDTAVLTAVPLDDEDAFQADRRIAQAQARAERAALRAAARAVPPELDDAYAHLSLSEMRAHRHDVAEAEERIGYWQRVAAHRLDAMRGTGNDVDVRRMNAELATKGLEHARTKLMRAARRPLPTLPTLTPLWGSTQDPKSANRLEKTIQELGEYHAALVTTAKAATAELIARYRQAPSDCLAILPA